MSSARPASLRRSRASVNALFFVNGAVIASWVPHIPAVKARHALSEAQLGLVLLAMAAAAVVALPAAGWLVARAGSRRVTAAAAIGLCVALPWPVLSPGVAFLVPALALLGAFNALLDVSMNAQAVEVERGYGRAIMSSFHALWSAGGLAGAALAGGAMSLGVARASLVVWTGIAGLGVVAGALPGLVRAARGSAAPVFVRPPRALLVLGGLAFAGLLTEGAVADWSALYLHDALGASAAYAAAGFAAFAAAMAAGRFAGDRAVDRFGARRVLRVSGAIAAAGLAVGLVSGSAVLAVIGFGAVGLGIANTIPILFSAAARVQGTPPAIALAAVTTTGYLGFLAGPPLIGLAAEVTSLPAALGLVCACCVLLAWGAGRLPAR
ncbi:MAG: MFS transporter [Candidatus Rokuibacteriota bacterium]